MDRPRRFGPYALGRAIGRGGAGTVYAARKDGPLGIGRVVALKIVPASETNDEARESFRREAAITVRLEHANVVRTYDVDVVAGELALAMELVHGASLAVLRSSPIPLAVAGKIADDALRGLHAAHELLGPDGTALGLVHQDVTPQNIVVGYDGTTKLLDFGVARLSAIDTSRTDTVRGKPAYLAPEQIEGGRLDRRVDVFAFGVVLFEMLTGKRLFQRDTVTATYFAVLTEPIPGADTLADVPLPIAGVVARALARPVGVRFLGAEEMRLALVAAFAEANVALASAEQVAAFVAKVAPPIFSHDELEREILHGPPDDPPGADEATLGVPPPPRTADRAPPRSEETIDGAPEPKRVSRKRWLAGLVLVAILLAVLAVLRRIGPDTHAAQVVQPSARPSVVTAVTSAPVLAPSVPSAPAPKSEARVAARDTQHVVSAPPRAVASSAVLDAGGPPGVAASATAATHLPTTLSISSTLWGHVVVDGTDRGTSPIKALPIAPGHHDVTVRTSEGERTKGVDCEAEKETKVRFVF